MRKAENVQNRRDADSSFNRVHILFKFQERRGSQDDDDEINEIDTGELRDQDRFLPIANVARIMKKAIPSQVNISFSFFQNNNVHNNSLTILWPINHK